jgi:hypothetical protein
VEHEYNVVTEQDMGLELYWREDRCWIWDCTGNGTEAEFGTVCGAVTETGYGTVRGLSPIGD